MNFAEEIIEWYQRNKRDLPWRKTEDPYIIWLSEIIMQQTRVEQGTPYFNRFAEKYPTVELFASASEDEILKLWQGLGYYSRGRNMHQTAQLVMEEHAGYFPKNYDSLIKLKGIGEYTAAAISSFSSNEARAVVDGNVFRLLSRYFGIDTPINTGKGKKLFTDLANELLDKSQAGKFNQAIMEFGSLQCKPKNPDCLSCPLQAACEARKTNRINELPVKIKSLKIRERYFNYIIAQKDGQILINKRGAGDIWENMFDLPLFETEFPSHAHDLIRSEKFISCFGEKVKIRSVSAPVKHILSHQKLHASFIEIESFSDRFLSERSWFYVGQDELEKLAQPKLIFHFFENFHKLNT
ncbi:A/G-specific adenine glycosylase [Daejeonella rubra]|uniref:Adenine DNA glycosylase n=1 Tax=Daejeonella rubra TaxID=990371 RepID=A0A1G9R087_9SPHI|nr:A/G-specific adenine glycosylase [Daejeonella rubra]SDM16644.1 A/G-specific adenine glycosylase [Daejeonella rubra]